mgnify:FL=1
MALSLLICKFSFDILSLTFYAVFTTNELWWASLAICMGFGIFDTSGCIALVRIASWYFIKTLISWKYAEVPQVTVDELHKLMLKRKGEFILIDVRTKEEFAVSHIKEAIHQDEFFIQEKKNKIGNETEIIIYCSVGLRSSAFARELRKTGYLNVKFCIGSFFEWMNHGFSVIDNQKHLTTCVHAHNSLYSLLLRKE